METTLIKKSQTFSIEYQKVRKKRGKFKYWYSNQFNLDQLIVMISYDDFDVWQVKGTPLENQQDEIENYLIELKDVTTTDLEHQEYEFQYQIEQFQT